MNNQQSFFESWVNVPHEVAGKKLKPFSLTHLIWLYQIQSPFVVTDKELSLADVELAAIICSNTTSEEIIKALNTPRRKWFKKKYNAVAEAKKFIAYNDDYVSLPRFRERKEETTEKLPWLLQNATALIKATGWSEETVFQMPLGKVLWFNLSLSYIETGDTQIVSDKEQAIVDFINGEALTIES